MNNYSIGYSSDYLAHHGIKGQKWGIRRYQNYDGSYTQAGMKRYNTSLENYNKAREITKLAKQTNKSGGLVRDPKTGEIKQVPVNKDVVKSAKLNEKLAKKQLNKDYKHLAQDKLADKGKARYASGQTITGRSEAARILGSIGSLTIAGVGYASRNGLIDSRTAQIGTGAGAALVGAAGVAKLINAIGDRELRAYYSHTSKY